jgi:hypothetical protein
MQTIYCGQARLIVFDTSDAIAAHATTATGTTASRHCARVKSDMRFVQRASAEANARTRATRSARRAAMHTRCSTGRASCTRCNTDMLDNRRLGRGRARGDLPKTLRWRAQRTVDCETAVQMHDIFFGFVPTRQLPLITR